MLGVALPFAVLAGLAVVAWAQIGGTAGWTPFVEAAAVVQLLGHGVDVRFAAPGGAFTVTIALLGPALVTALAAARAGRRAAGTASPVACWTAGWIATAACSAGLLVLATSPAATPVAWQAVVLPTALVAAVSLLAMRAGRLPAGVRTGLAAAALLVGAAAVLVSALLIVHFAEVIGLYEGLAAGPSGALVVTAGQMLALPTLVVWAAAWAAGAPVALGAGSATGAFGTQVGPLPGLPLLGVVPPDPPAAAAALLLVPVLAGVTAGVLARRGGVRTGAIPLGLVGGVTAGALLGLLALAASGSAGPGRFAEVGPDPGLVALLVVVEVALPVTVAAALVRPRAAPSRTDGAGEAEEPGR